MPVKGSGTGMRLTEDGYLEIVRRGPLRWRRAHRAYVERQIGRPLRRDEEVHHLCRNRACWPPSDWHLVLMDACIHDAVEAINGGKHYRHRRNCERARSSPDAKDR